MPALLLRHGPTSSLDRLAGQTPVTLTARGVEAAIRAARQLSGMPLSHIYASDTPSAAQTAQVIGTTTMCPVSLHSALRSWDVGSYAGLPEAEGAKVLTDLVDHPTLPAPGGESFYQFLLRFLGFTLPLLRTSGLSLVVTHSKPIKLLQAHLAAYGQGIDRAVWDESPLLAPLQPVYVTATAFTPLEGIHA